MYNTSADITSTEATFVSDLQEQMGRVVDEYLEVLPKNQDGTFIGGSYDPKTATGEILFGDTYCILGDDGDMFINHQRLPLLTTQIGDLYGPTGVERTVAIATSTGYGLIYKHGEDDTPAPPAGERWILHKNVASQTQPAAVYDGGHQLTNDGTTPGDGKGGTRVGYKGDWTDVHTNSGHIMSQSDTNKQVILQSAGGHVLTYNDPGNPLSQPQSVKLETIGGMTDTFNDQNTTIVRAINSAIQIAMDGVAQTVTAKAATNLFVELDAINQVITHQGSSTVYQKIDASGTVINTVAPKVGLGDTFANLGSTLGAVNAGIMNDATSGYKKIITDFGNTNFQNFAAVLQASASGLPASFTTFANAVAAAVAGSWVTGLASLTGSSTVRIKS